ncbi:MAG: polyprenol monophosphomannose synthase [Chloroflexi bacterium]|nr:polyprenol monophosphomannose synthase [Chloroflexota bacterium]
MKTVVVIPTYNEASNIEKIGAALLALDQPDLSVLIVDDNSPDGTGRIANELQAHSGGRVSVLHRAGKGGLGAAYVAGFGQALADGADLIIQMDADFSHSPAYVPQLIAKIADCDVVVGSRYVAGGSVDQRWSAWRNFLSRWANRVWVGMFLGLKVRDATAGFKCWRRSALERIDLSHIKSSGYGFQVEMAFLCERLCFRVCETPIHFEDRRIGQSKMDMGVKLEGAFRVLEIRWRYRFGRTVAGG